MPLAPDQLLPPDRIAQLARRAAAISRTVREADPCRTLPDPSDGPAAHDLRIDAGALLAATPSLRLRAGAELRVATRLQGGNGLGRVYAAFPDGERPTHDAILAMFDGTLRSLPAPAEALRTDGTLQSYFDLSILLRALGDTGSRWHGGSWWACRVIDRALYEGESDLRGVGRLAEQPWRLCERVGVAGYSHGRWERALDPEVVRDGADVVVRFVVVCSLGVVRMRRVEDRYCGGGSDAETRVLFEVKGEMGILT